MTATDTRSNQDALTRRAYDIREAAIAATGELPTDSKAETVDGYVHGAFHTFQGAPVWTVEISGVKYIYKPSSIDGLAAATVGGSDFHYALTVWRIGRIFL